MSKATKLLITLLLFIFIVSCESSLENPSETLKTKIDYNVDGTPDDDEDVKPVNNGG